MDHGDGPLPSWLKVHGMIQIAMVVYDEERGWLITKRGAIYGGRHGEAPMIAGDLPVLERIIGVEIRSGLRALKARWRA